MLAPEAASDALLQTAEDVLDISQQFVPVDKGDLKRSGGTDITKMRGDSAVEVVVGYGTGLPIYDGDQSYANAQEYGTVNMAAQPYLTPAFAQAEPTFKARLLEKLKKLA